MGRILCLSLLIAISCLAQAVDPPCNGKHKLTPCADPKKKCPTYNATHYFDCPGDTLIYTPDKGYRVELTSIMCNETTKEWQAMEQYDVLTQRRQIDKAGEVECRDRRKMSCTETRLDFSDLSYEAASGAVDPIVQYSTGAPDTVTHYECAKEHHFFYIAKFALQPHEGLYLRGSPTCKSGNLTAPFASRSEPVEISYLGSITCKKFSCLDSNDASHLWPLILRMPSKCVGVNCVLPDWYNEKFPCGSEGHELAVYAKESGKEKMYWLKDHFFTCTERARMFYFDGFGRRRELIGDEHFACMKPPSCRPLMSDASLTYGCMKRSSCHDISTWLIPTAHLSSFNGRCFYDEAILKIVTSETSVTPGIELASVSCKFGEWSATLLEGSYANGENLRADEIKIDEKTNFVCEGRDEFTHCPAPKANCEGEVAKSLCKRAKIKEGKSLECDTGMQLVLRRFDKDLDEQIEPIKGDLVCDRRGGKWVESEFPFTEPGGGDDWQQHVVCANTQCTTQLTSSCGSIDKCREVQPPSYWLYAKCEYPYTLKYGRGGIKTETAISKLYCDPAESPAGSSTVGTWKFTENGVKKSSDGKDIFYCKLDEIAMFPAVSPDTSPQCQPTKLDSVCLYDVDTCIPVEKRAVVLADKSTQHTWECANPQLYSLWYYATGSTRRVEITNLTCAAATGPFWRAVKKGDSISAAFVPPPHANFVCHSSAPPAKEWKRPAPSGGSAGKSGRKWQWPIEMPDTVALGVSLLLFAVSASILIWTRRKQYLASLEEVPEENNTLKSLE